MLDEIETQYAENRWCARAMLLNEVALMARANGETDNYVKLATMASEAAKIALFDKAERV